MRSLAIICLTAWAFNFSNGGLIYEKWREGAAGEHPLYLEPYIANDELYNILLENVGTYISHLDYSLTLQLSQLGRLYRDSAYRYINEIVEDVGRINGTSPPDELDNIMLNICGTLSDVIQGVGSDKVGAAKEASVFSEPRLHEDSATMVAPVHSFGDLLKKMKDIINYDLNLVFDYVRDTLVKGQSNVLIYIKEIESSNYRYANMTVDAMNDLLVVMGEHKDVIDKYTSKTILDYYYALREAMPEIN